MDRSVMLKATSADENPTPGYLYGEIAKMTNRGGDAVHKICSFLIERLVKSSDPNVKYKCLMVIKQTCRKGDQTFRRLIRNPNSIAAIKSCLQFTGTPHPLKGDHPYRAVRDAAKDTLEVVFDDTVETADKALAQRIQGYGAAAGGGSAYDSFDNDHVPSSHHGARALPSENMASYSSNSYGHNMSSGGAAGGSGKKYEGFGNPNYRDARLEPKGFMDRVRDRIEEYSDVATKKVAQSGIQQWLGNTPPPKSADRNRNYYDNQPAPQQSYTYQSSHPSAYHAPAVSGGASGATSQFSQSSTNAWGPATTQTLGGVARNTETPASDGTYERRLVDELCSRGGVRPVPAREKLSNFVSACQTLNPQVVMPILYEKLESNDWKVQHKALCVFEALIESGQNESYVDYIDENAEILEELNESTQPTIRSRCKKIWVLLYGEEEALQADTENTTAPKTASRNAEDVDLLYMADGGSAESGGGVYEAPILGEQAQSKPVPAQPQGNSLFANLAVKGNSSTPASSNNGSSGGVFEGLTIQSTTAAIHRSNDEVDLLGSPTIQSSSQRSAPQQNSLVNDMGSLNLRGANSRSPTATSQQGFAFLDTAPVHEEPSDNVLDFLKANPAPTNTMPRSPLSPTVPMTYTQMGNRQMAPIGYVGGPPSQQPSYSTQPSPRGTGYGMQPIKPQQQQSLRRMTSPQAAQPDKFDFVSMEMGKMK